MERLSSKAMRTAPKRIWLQCGDDPEASRCNFSELAEVTWSSDKATTVCIEYVRADLVRDCRSGDAEANARLIVAAPDLLAVVQELQESASYWSEYDVPLGIVDRINAAIAKAVGMTANA